MIGGSYILSSMVYGAVAGIVLLPLSVIVDAVVRRWKR